MSISVEQRFQVLAALGANIDWDSLTKEQVQVGVRESARAGAEMTAFIFGGFRTHTGDFFTDTGELSIEIPALPRPTIIELREKFSWIREIERDTSPTNAATLTLATSLRPGEDLIGGEEYERRLAPKLNISLSYQHGVWLVEHQDEYPALMALLGKVYIDLPGLVVVNVDGYRSVPCLGQSGERWYLRWSWLDDDFSRRGRVALSSK